MICSVPGVGAPEDFVLAPKPSKGRNPGNGDGATEHGPERPRNFPAQPPILRISCSPLRAWMTEPEPRKRSPLKNACVIK